MTYDEAVTFVARQGAKYGEPSSPSEFYDRLLSVGAIPPALVRESLFARKAAEVAAQGRARQD